VFSGRKIGQLALDNLLFDLVFSFGILRIRESEAAPTA
jgi:hypothetical protein